MCIRTTVVRFMDLLNTFSTFVCSLLTAEGSTSFLTFLIKPCSKRNYTVTPEMGPVDREIEANIT